MDYYNIFKSIKTKTMEIDINGVKITLTKDQLAEIDRQVNKKLSIDQIDYESAKALLKEHNIDPDPKGLYSGVLLQLITIIKAVNFIDNGYKEWFPIFNNNQNNYLPWFSETPSGWSVNSICHCYCSHSGGLAGFYYKVEKSALLITNKYLDLYSKIL